MDDLTGDLTYDEIGATRRTPWALPPGYRHLRHRTRLGPVALAAAADAVPTWRMHRAAGARITSSAPRAAPGVTVVTSFGVGPLRIEAPCRAVEVVESPDCPHRESRVPAR